MGGHGSYGTNADADVIGGLSAVLAASTSSGTCRGSSRMAVRLAAIGYSSSWQRAAGDQSSSTNLIGRVCGDADAGGGGGGGGGLVHQEVLDVPAGERLGEVLGDAAAVAAVAGCGRGRRGEAAAAVLVLRRRGRAGGRLGGEAHAGEQEPGVAHGQLAGRVHRHVAVPAQDRPVLLAE
jgi:hypothetical protein